MVASHCCSTCNHTPGTVIQTARQTSVARADCPTTYARQTKTLFHPRAHCPLNFAYVNTAERLDDSIPVLRGLRGLHHHHRSLSSGPQQQRRWYHPKPITHETLWMMKAIYTVVRTASSSVFSVVELSRNRPVRQRPLARTADWPQPCAASPTPEPRRTMSRSPDSAAVISTQARRRRVRADLHSRSRRRRRSALPPFRGRKPQWRPDGKAILFRAWSAQCGQMTERKIAEDAGAQIQRRDGEHFQCATGINGWMTASPPSWFSPSNRVPPRRTFSRPPPWPVPRGSPERKPRPASPSRRCAGVPTAMGVVFTATRRWNARPSPRSAITCIAWRRTAARNPAILTPAAGRQARWPACRRVYKFAPQDGEIYHVAQLQKLAWPGAEASPANPSS